MASLPNSVGWNVRRPIERFTMATVTTMMTSRLITSTVSQIGNRLGRSTLGIMSTTNVEINSSLSAIGSSSAPSVVPWPHHRARIPSSASVSPAPTRTTSAHPFNP